MQDWMKSVRERGTAGLVALGLVSVVLFVFGLLTDTFWMRVLVKPIPVWVCALLVISYRSGSMGRRVAIGLVVSGVGDVLLELSFPGSFIAGMIAFLVGHVMYAWAFFKEASERRLLEFLPFLVWGGCIGALAWSGLGVLRIPVMVYMSVILVMMWRATVFVAQKRATHGIWIWLAMVGALFYGLSDSLIALNKFHQSLAYVRPPISLTYWIGQAMISLVSVKLAHTLRIKGEQTS